MTTVRRPFARLRARSDDPAGSGPAIGNDWMSTLSLPDAIDVLTLTGTRP
jgi:hypothetical protein